MATEALANEDPSATIQRWQRDGPTVEEKDAYAEAMIAQLADAGMKSLQAGTTDTTFQTNIGEVAGAVKSIHEMFKEIDRTFQSLITTAVRNVHRALPEFRRDWMILRQCWRRNLGPSAHVAAMTMDMLYRFENSYLNQLQNVKSDEDRIAAAQALLEFIASLGDGNNDKSSEVSRAFLDIKRDVAVYLERFGQWITANVTASCVEAVPYKLQIVSLQGQIESLNQSIQSAHQELSLAGGSSRFFHVGLGASFTIWTMQNDRDQKLRQLRAAQDSLGAIEYKGQPILKLKASMDIWKPDLDLVCDRLILIAEIWSSVRSQAIQFRGHLEGGRGALSNMRFRTEVRLARAICAPLMEGLVQYSSGIEPIMWDTD